MERNQKSVMKVWQSALVEERGKDESEQSVKVPTTPSETVKKFRKNTKFLQPESDVSDGE